MSEAAARLMRRLPWYWQESQTMRAITAAEGPEIDDLRESIKGVAQDFRPQTASRRGIGMYEVELGLSDGTFLDNDVRRERVMAKLQSAGSVTAKKVQDVAGQFTYGRVQVTENYSDYSVTLRFMDVRGIPPQINEIVSAIRAILPAHLALNYVTIYTVWDEIDAMFMTWDDLDAMEITWDDFLTLTAPDTPVGTTWADLLSAYATWGDVAASGYATWGDLLRGLT